MKRERRAWVSFWTNRSLGLVLDCGALGVAYLASILLRFDLHAPRWGWRVSAVSFLTVAAVHLLALFLCGCYRLSWRRTRIADLPRYAVACLLACIVLTLLRVAFPVDIYSHIRPPYSVTLICFFLSSLAVMVWRIAWSWYWSARIDENNLLERSVRKMDASSAIAFLKGKTVLVTGAGGTIGSELVRQVAQASPKMLLLVERGENALYEIDREMRERGTTAPMRPLMVDITDLPRMESIFNTYHPEIVLHAAAYKHVPMVEMNPDEGWRNNTQATKDLAEMAKRFGVLRFVMISTDKAVNPVSVMGKTKLAAEQEIMKLNGEGTTSFCAVRFGNVLGSSGSVLPLFKEQVAHRRPLTVTHPDMQRYFMTVTEAVGLVLQAASRQEKAIYTLDMGEPVKIVDLAEQVIRQAGYKPYVDIPIHFTGIRPGEKLFEELDVSKASTYFKTDMARIYITKTT